MSYNKIRKVALPTLGVFLGAFSLSSDSWAGSTAAQTTPGYLSVDPGVCGTGPSPCFVQYGSVVPISGSFSASVSVTNPTIAAAVPATANYIAGNKGGLLTGVTLDGSSNLNVNCAVGCAGGSFNNNADNVATTTTNGQAAAWMYAWDGSAWDRLYNGNGTSAQALRVSISNDSTGVITGTGTAGSAAVGVFTVQGIAAMTPILTTPSQATTASLNATVNVNAVGGSAVTLGTKTSANSIPVVIASDYGIAAGATTSGQLGSIIMGAATTIPPLYTTAKTDFLSLTVNGGLREDLASIGGVTASFATMALGATGAAVPANAIYQGANVGGNNTGMIACGTSTVYDAATNGGTQLIASTSSAIYVCGFNIFAAGTVNVDLVYGTGTACSSGTTKLTPAYQLTTQTGIVDSAAYYRGIKVPANNQLCISTSAGVNVQALVYTTAF